MPIPMNEIRGTGCYTGKPTRSSTSTALFVHDDYGDLVRIIDREPSYQSMLPHGFVPRIPVCTPVQA